MGSVKVIFFNILNDLMLCQIIKVLKYLQEFILLIMNHLKNP